MAFSFVLLSLLVSLYVTFIPSPSFSSKQRAQFLTFIQWSIVCLNAPFTSTPLFVTWFESCIQPFFLRNLVLRMQNWDYLFFTLFIKRKLWPRNSHYRKWMRIFISFISSWRLVDMIYWHASIKITRWSHDS